MATTRKVVMPLYVCCFVEHNYSLVYDGLHWNNQKPTNDLIWIHYSLSCQLTYVVMWIFQTSKFPSLSFVLSKSHSSGYNGEHANWWKLMPFQWNWASNKRKKISLLTWVLFKVNMVRKHFMRMVQTHHLIPT